MTENNRSNEEAKSTHIELSDSELGSLASDGVLKIVDSDDSEQILTIRASDLSVSVDAIVAGEVAQAPNGVSLSYR